MYGKENQDLYATFKEKGKEFVSNGITSVAVHPTKNDYVLIGYQQGQIVLIDVCNVEKSLKVIKDAHKGIPIANLEFCDLIKIVKEKPQSQGRFARFKKNKKKIDETLDALDQAVQKDD